MEILNAILYQFQTISLPWWIVIGFAAVLLLIFRHKREQLPGDVLIVYILVILASTVLSRPPIDLSERSELINLDLIGTWRERLSGDIYGKSELLLNFCMLLPVGLLFPWAAKKGFFPTVLIGLGLILIIELAQFFTGLGWFELSDIVDNTIGVMIGYVLYRIGEVIWRKIKC